MATKGTKAQLNFCAFCAFLWLNSIDAAVVALDDVLGAFDGNTRSEDGSEQIELGRTEPLTSIRRRANRTMVFDQ